MENYKIKQNFYGIMQAYITPLLSLAIVISFLIAYRERQSTLMLVYIVVVVGLVAYRYMMYVNRPMEIAVNGNDIEFKSILGKITKLNFADITDIEVNKRRELFFNLRDKKIRGLNTFKDFDKFIEDAKKKNPEIKLWGFGK